MSVDVSLSGYSRERGLQFYSELLERVQRLPGVEAVSLATQIALGDGFGATMRAEGYAPKPGEDMSSDFNQIGPDYFRVMKIPLLEGREFGQSDTTNTPLVGRHQPDGGAPLLARPECDWPARDRRAPSRRTSQNRRRRRQGQQIPQADRGSASRRVHTLLPALSRGHDAARAHHRRSSDDAGRRAA